MIFKTRSLQFRINVVLVMITILSLVTLGFGTYRMVSALLLQEINKSIEYTTRALDREVQLIYEDIDYVSKNMHTNIPVYTVMKTYPDFAHPLYVSSSIQSFTYMTNLLSSKPYIRSVYLYKNNEVVFQAGTNDRILNNSEAGEPPFSKMAELKPFEQIWVPDDIKSKEQKRDRFLSSYMGYYDINSSNYLGMIEIDIDLDQAFRILKENVTGERKIFLVTNDGKLLFATDADTARVSLPDILKLRFDEKRVPLNLGNKDYLLSKYESGSGKWFIISAIPKEEINENSRKVLNFIVIFMIVCGTLIIFIAFFISSRSFQSVNRLTEIMRRINFDKDLEPQMGLLPLMKQSNEIGLFSRSFSKMIERLGIYMEEIKQAHKKQKNLELELLISQIKPHFLYNTLESFCGLADLKRTEDIYRLAKSLGIFYRISLSKGAHVITVKEELEHVESYLIIEKMKFNKFDYAIDIDKSTQGCKMIKLILQPIIENAITHGIRKREGQGFIYIRATKNGDFLEFLVKDDGAGMDPDTMQALNQNNFTSSGKNGFGIKNVHERISLFYGEAFGLHFASGEPGGLEVTILIPLQHPQPEVS
jgi:two-component system sensor histidine kinase YesM